MTGKPKSLPADPLAAAMEAVNKEFGDGTVGVLGQFQTQRVEVISTGSIGLDAATGIGGVPRGRVTEIFGPEASGKTTVAMHVLANAQKLGLRAAMVDAEHALDPDYAKRLGVDTDALLFSQPDSGEQALTVVSRLTAAAQAQADNPAIAGNHPLGVIVIDSVAALVPQAEIDGEMGDSHIGLQARLLGQALRKLTAPLHDAGIACIFVNQLRSRVGVFMGSPDTTTGGRALPFYASLRLDARGIGNIKDGNDIIGRATKVKCTKNKLSPPFRSAEFDILFGRGISREGELLDMGKQFGLVLQKGAWFYLGKHTLGQGREIARQALMAEPELAADLEKDIRSASQGKLFTVAPPEPANAALPLPPARTSQTGAVSR